MTEIIIKTREALHVSEIIRHSYIQTDKREILDILKDERGKRRIHQGIDIRILVEESGDGEPNLFSGVNGSVKKGFCIVVSSDEGITAKIVHALSHLPNSVSAKIQFLPDNYRLVDWKCYDYKNGLPLLCISPISPDGAYTFS